MGLLNGFPDGFFEKIRPEAKRKIDVKAIKWSSEVEKGKKKTVVKLINNK